MLQPRASRFGSAERNPKMITEELVLGLCLYMIKLIIMVGIRLTLSSYKKEPPIQGKPVSTDRFHPITD